MIPMRPGILDDAGLASPTPSSSHALQDRGRGLYLPAGAEIPDSSLTYCFAASKS